MALRAKFTLKYAPEVYEHLKAIERKHHRLLAETIKEQFSYTQEAKTKNRKPLEEPASFGATWELRFGPKNAFRVFYDVNHEDKLVSVLAIGVKDGNRLCIGGRSLDYENRSARRREGPSQRLCRRMRERRSGRHHAQRKGGGHTARPEGRRRFGTADIGALASFPALARKITEKPKNGQRRFARQILENGRPASWS
jgi:mRNA-degrading endonuclease RelE of RelBE toxin-antitoxin system